MACNSIQSSSSSLMIWKYDVFVSFRGEDTRNNFTDHLFGALHRKGILAFKDDTKLKKGEHISSELLQAIEASRILIVVFSRNYASSTWCLRELAKIADCIEVPGQTILPIFYNVSPSEVRKQSGDYEKAFVEHEERFKDNLEEVQRWRGALAQVANLSGWDVRDKPQYAEIGKIIKEVTCLLDHKFSTLPGELVGMHSRVEELEKLLVLDSDDDVRVVGICGMGGIGKTTLATVLYDRISNQFDASCFIDDVSKIYGNYGPIGAQKQLLCQTLNEENLQICNISMASKLIRTRLCQIKALLVLDNVEQVEQLDKLAMKREQLGAGSRIIIISRDGHILREHGVDEVYKVQLLDYKYALQLFCRKAFKCDDVMRDYIYLTDDVLTYANGLPLAIKVLGSFLYGRDVSEWRSALARLREYPRTDIMDVLRFSFDRLEDTEREIFLDIACFFYEKQETYVKKVLDFRGFHPEIGIRVLIDKSLLTREKGRIFMHDLLKELGKSVVREKSPKEPRKWSRLWDYKDVHNVISKNMETGNLEAIVLRRYPENIEVIQEMTTLRAEALAQMSHLKLLILWNLDFSGSLNFLSSELGYLYWDKYPFTCLPSSFEPDKLVELILPHSNIRQLWEGTKMKYLPELPSRTVLPVRKTFFGRYQAGLYIFDCPNLREMECCYRMAFSWMIQLIEVHMQSYLPLGQMDIVVPGTQIPMWFNKQNVGSSISMDPSPIMHDNNWIGVACCLTFVAHDDPTNLSEGRRHHDDPTNLGERWLHHIGLGFKNKERGRFPIIPIHLEKDLVTVALDHLLLIFFTREEFIEYYVSYITKGMHDMNGIELATIVEQPRGLHLKVKNCGYRWVFKEDLEQLNPKMIV